MAEAQIRKLAKMLEENSSKGKMIYLVLAEWFDMQEEKKERLRAISFTVYEGNTQKYYLELPCKCDVLQFHDETMEILKPYVKSKKLCIVA